MTQDKIRILLVEDDKSLASVIKDYMSLSGYQVTLCEDGNSALEAFKKPSRPGWRRSGRDSRRACVDAPSGARRIFGQLRRWIGCCHVSGLCCGGSQAAGPYGSSWIRSTSLKRARSALPSPGSPDPASPTFAPYLSFDLLTPSTASRPPTAYAATAGAR